MSEIKTSERVAAEQMRRRAFLEELPPCFCPNCSAVVYEGEEICANCDGERPVDGWPDLSTSMDPWLGEVLADRYLITRHVASSKRARVYIADSRVIPRSFAVKIMNVTGGPDLDQEGLRRRLRREVEALGTLRNPHIVSFYDVFDPGSDHVAFVMDLIDGVTLGELMADGPLSLPRAMGLLRQLANGVFEAHERGLVHRDLKPANVMVEKLPIGDEFVRILDFGVMWVRGTTGRTGAFDEMPVFASPEQIADEPVDQRADLYSLGALAFYMLTGVPPFDPNDFSNPQALLTEDPPLLEEVTGFEFPAQVEALVSKLLSKEPAGRPESVGRLLEWLDDIGDLLSQVQEDDEYDGQQEEEEEEEWESSSSATAFGMVPTLNEASSPVVRLEPSEMSAVSEASVVSPPTLMCCRGEGYGYVQDSQVHWAGAFAGQEPADLDPQLEYISLGVSASRAVLGTRDGRIVLAHPGEQAETAFQDPRLTAISAVAIVADGESIIAGSESGRLYMNRGTDFVRMGGGDEAVSALGLNDRGDQFAVARGSSIQILSVTASNLSTFPSPLNEEVVSMAFSPDDYLVAVLTASGSVVLESVHTGQEFMRLDTGNPALRALTFSADNHLMGLFSEDDRVILRALT